MTLRARRPKKAGVEARKPYDIDSLTDVALAVFADRGYDGASMDDVARAAGITKASIYHHVAGKEALLERGLNRALDALFAILDEPSATTGAADARFAFIVRRVVETTLTRLPELTVLFRVRGASDVQRDALDRRRAFDRHIAELVATAQAEGTVRTDIEARTLVRLIFGMSNSVVEWYRPGGAIAPAQLADTLVALAWTGIGSTSGCR
jgi:AcrR family transcriptional regulator